jgi:hypothetical protein
VICAMALLVHQTRLVRASVSLVTRLHWWLQGTISSSNLVLACFAYCQPDNALV